MTKTATFKFVEVAESGNTHVVEAHNRWVQPFPVQWCQSLEQAEKIAAELNGVLDANQ